MKDDGSIGGHEEVLGLIVTTQPRDGANDRLDREESGRAAAPPVGG